MTQSTNAKSANGVLPIPAAALKKTVNNSNASRGSTRAPAARVKLILRRLPPGLTQDEFVEALGLEWRVAAGKIEWLAYKEGKISKDPSKPSRPSRAYVKVKEQALINVLSETVKQTTFQDSKNSTKDPCLIGPPSLEFAPYGRVPAGRRKDGRQGTIDQDPEFINFLHSLTEPVTKPPVNGDATDAENKSEKVTTTPLIQFIKDKKASKAKEKAEKAAEKSAKAQKNNEAKDSKSEKTEAKKVSLMKKEAEEAKPAGKQPHLEKATKEAVKALNRQAAAIKAGEPVSKSSASTNPKNVTTPSPAKRERGSARTVIQTLQRDLAQAGSPKNDRRGRASKATAAAGNGTNEQPPTSKLETTTPIPKQIATKPVSPVPSSNPPPATKLPPATVSGSKTNKVAIATQQTAANTSARPLEASLAPSPGATSAFLKHANPSQGITEALLEEAFTTFGTVTNCHIDKKKGFAYVDFTDTEALKAAMAASPIKIGDKGGNVVVLERKGPPPRSVAGTPSITTITSATQSVAEKSPVPATITSDTKQAKTDVVPPTPPATITTTSVVAPPTAPKGAPAVMRGGHGRGGGGQGGGFGRGRGGRGGGLRGRGGRGGGAQAQAQGISSSVADDGTQAGSASTAATSGRGDAEKT